MVDRDLVDDFFRAYSYFRWADDVIDNAALSKDKCISFVKRQGQLIDRLYKNERPDDLAPQEEVLADLVGHDRAENSGLQSFIRNMFALIRFDAQRKGRLISEEELAWYSGSLTKSVTDGIQYFIGNGHPYPEGDDRYSAATGAHVAHLLRDALQDTADGFINIPAEYLEKHEIGPDDVGKDPYRAWVRSRVTLARKYLRDGKRYLDELDVLRCKIAGYWYCARFEGILAKIERDGFVLRAEYDERHHLTTWFKIAWIGARCTGRHLISRIKRAVPGSAELV